MKVAVLGVGLIGGSIGLAARQRMGADVIGYDPDPATAAAALEGGAVDRVAAGPAEACGSAEVVFCAAPVGDLVELAGAALVASGPETVVTDAGSTKLEIVSALGDDERFVGGHPLAGAETAGVANAREELFEGARWYLTPTAVSSGVLYDRLQRTIAGFGARPHAIEAAAHDRLMATASHLPHVIANAVADEAAAELRRDSERLADVGPSLRDATRVAGANPEIWGDIFASNRKSLADAVDSVIARLQRASELIREGDGERLSEWQRGAAGARRALLESESPGGPVKELRLVVPNRPGIVAGLALALGDAGINIEDMALHPAQDNSTGAIALWVAGDAEADRAAALVREMGHAVSVVEGGD
jgi:prephenate dehydrogenase